MEKMIAFCGIVCAECPAFLATKMDDDNERKKITYQFMNAQLEHYLPKCSRNTVLKLVYQDCKKFFERNKELVTDLLKLEKTDAELLDNVFANNSQIMQERAAHVQEVMERIESED